MDHAAEFLPGAAGFVFGDGELAAHFADLDLGGGFGGVGGFDVAGGFLGGGGGGRGHV